MIVAYPENNEKHDVPKEFAFEYWVDATLKPVPPSPDEVQEEQEVEKNKDVPY